MHFLVAVEMDRPIEGGDAACIVDFLLEQQGVGADGHEFAAPEGALDDLGQFLVEQRLAAGDHHDRRAAFLDRPETFVDRQALVQDLVGIIDLAAAGAGEIATEQGLEHENERIALAPRKMLADHIGADFRHLRNGIPTAALVLM